MPADNLLVITDRLTVIFTHYLCQQFNGVCQIVSGTQYPENFWQTPLSLHINSPGFHMKLPEYSKDLKNEKKQYERAI